MNSLSPRPLADAGGAGLGCPPQRHVPTRRSRPSAWPSSSSKVGSAPARAAPAFFSASNTIRPARGARAARRCRRPRRPAARGGAAVVADGVAVVAHPLRAHPRPHLPRRRPPRRGAPRREVGPRPRPPRRRRAGTLPEAVQLEPSFSATPSASTLPLESCPSSRMAAARGRRFNGGLEVGPGSSSSADEKPPSRSLCSAAAGSA